MLPRVILHNAVSVDGRIDWFTGDIGLYYELADRWKPDAMLSGSNTIASAFPTAEEEGPKEALEPPEKDPDDPRQLLVVPDSRGRIRNAPDLTSLESVIELRLTHVENMRGDVVWLRYEVVK